MRKYYRELQEIIGYECFECGTYEDGEGPMNGVHCDSCGSSDVDIEWGMEGLGCDNGCGHVFEPGEDYFVEYENGRLTERNVCERCSEVLEEEE